MSGKFSQAADETILHMRANGYHFGAILAEVRLLMPNEAITDASVRHRYRWIRMTPAERKKRKDMLNARRRQERPSRALEAAHRACAEDTIIVRSIKIPPETLADRARRYALEPRSLSASLLGDPLPGYSALDQMAKESA